MFLNRGRITCQIKAKQPLPLLFYFDLIVFKKAQCQSDKINVYYFISNIRKASCGVFYLCAMSHSVQEQSVPFLPDEALLLLQLQVAPTTFLNKNLW